MESTINTLLITQARLGSTRLPRKVLLKIDDDELLKLHLERLKASTEVDKIVVATTTSDEDTEIVSKCQEWGYSVARGSVEDVLDRFYQVAKVYKPKWVVRATSDCPLIDSKIVDAVIKLAQLNDVDYASNILVEHFPDGQDIEVFKFSALEKAWNEAQLKSDREHVTLYLRNNSSFKGGNIFTSVNLPCVADYASVRMTVDEERDFHLIKRLVEDIGTKHTWLDYTNYILKHHLNQINGNIIRNEGLQKSLKNDLI